MEKEASDHVEDFLSGIYNTVVGVPTSFGDFLGRVSGFRDWQNEDTIGLENREQNQALIEVKILYEALTHEKSAIAIKNALIEDFQERPAYYIGGMGIQQGLSTTLSKIAKVGYGTTMTSTKMESAINEKYNTVKEISQLEDENFNILTEDILSTVNWFDNFEENINIYREENKKNDFSEKQENLVEDYIILDDENIISGISVELKNKNVENQTQTFDSTAKAQEILEQSNLNDFSLDNEYDNGRDIDY